MRINCPELKQSCGIFVKSKISRGYNFSVQLKIRNEFDESNISLIYNQNYTFLFQTVDTTL